MSLLVPLEYEFFRNGFLAAVVVGALCGFIGVYVVLRRMSYIGHGLAHAIFGGAVLSYVMNVNFYVGAGLWALFAGWLIHLISHRRWVGADAAIGVVTTSSFALGVAIISTYRSFTRNIETALFGNILGITQKDLWIVVLIALIVFAVLIILRRQLLFATFDPEVASAYGVSTGKIDLIFITLLAITVLASTQILGVTLVAAAMQYTQEAKLVFPIALDLNSTVKRAYRIFGPPATFFIDSQGTIRDIVIGPITLERAREGLRKAGATL